MINRPVWRDPVPDRLQGKTQEGLHDGGRCNGGGGMMIGMNLVWLLIVVVLVLGAVALVKYIRSDGES